MVWIILGAKVFVLGIITLLGKIDKWLIYPLKQANIKRFRLVTGIGYLLAGVCFILNGSFGYNAIIFQLFWILFIVVITLQYTWCRKLPEN